MKHLKGACFTNYDGEIVTEIANLTGAYIDDVRGALKVTDVTPDEYPAGLSIFEDGGRVQGNVWQGF